MTQAVALPSPWLRRGLSLAMLAGVAGFAALMLANGMSGILQGVAMIGPGLALLVVTRLVSLTLAGLAWFRLLRGRVALPATRYVGLRIIREAINCILPVAQVGGDLIGGRLLARAGVAAGLAGASILVDLVLQVMTQATFALAGLALLWALFGVSEAVRRIGTSLVLALPLLVGFLLVQRIGLFALVDRGAGLAARFWPGGICTGRLDLQPGLDLIHADRRAVGQAVVLHLAGWALGSVEIWVALTGMGEHPTAAGCIVLESLGQAVRSAGFAVPAAIGIQEGGFVVLGALFGLTAPVALALSIAKRLPDVAIGLPGVAAWQILEWPRAEAKWPH
jgi:putative membrane protein